MEIFSLIFRYLVLSLEFAGAGVTVIGILLSSVFALRNILRHKEKDIYQSFRMQVGRSIILGLELLIAADIIRSLTTQFDFKSIGLLGILILIRTFLSFSLEVEVYGKWPWQSKSNK